MSIAWDEKKPAGGIEWDDEEPGARVKPAEANAIAHPFAAAKAVFGGPEGMGEEEKATARQGAAALLGAVNGLTLGHTDEIVGGLEALKDQVRGDPRSLVESYRRRRDELRELQRRARVDSPWATGLAEVGGGALLPGPKVTGLKSALAAGAKLGAAAGAGESEADLTQGEFGKYLAEALGGGVGGAVLGGGLHALPGALRSIGGTAKKALLGLEHEQANAVQSAMGKYAERQKDKQAAFDRLLAAKDRAGRVEQELAARKPSPAGLAEPTVADGPGAQARLGGQKTVEAQIGAGGDSALEGLGAQEMQDALKQRVASARKDYFAYKDLPKPVPADIIAQHEALQRGEARAEMRRGAGKVGLGVAAAYLGSPIGYFAAGASGPYGVRHFVAGVMKHPGAVARLSKLHGWGTTIANAAAKGDAALLPVLATLYQREPEVREEMDHLVMPPER